MKRRVRSAGGSRAAGALAAAALLLGGTSGAGAAEQRHPELAPPGECATPLVSGAGAVPLPPGAVPAVAGEPGPGASGGGGGAGGVGVAVVASIVGPAQVTGPDGSARSLGCGDPIFPGDRLSTPEGSSAGLLLGDAVVQLGGGSVLAVGGDAGAPELSLESGSLRVIDPSGDGAPVGVEALGARTSISGGDVQIGVSGQGGGASAAVCALEGSAPVRSGSASAVASAGSCTVVSPGAILGSQPAPAERLPALGGVCEFRAQIEPFAHLEPTPAVASGSQRNLPPLPEPNEGLPRSPCDLPGPGCSREIRVFEPPPSTSDFPGGETRN